MAGVTKREKCGHPKNNGETCKMGAGYGTGHAGWGKCKFHGGSSPSHENAAAKAIIIEKIAAFGSPIEIDPGTALLMEVKRSAGVVDWLSRVIAVATGEIDLSHGSRYARDVVQTLGEHGRETAVWVELFFKERRHLAQVSKMALDAGVAERQIQLAEDQGRLVATLIQSILGDLNLTLDQQAQAPTIVRKHLLALEA